MMSQLLWIIWRVICMMSHLLCISTGICSAVQKTPLQPSTASECYTLSASSSVVILSLGRRRSVCTFHLTTSTMAYSGRRSVYMFHLTVSTMAYSQRRSVYMFHLTVSDVAYSWHLGQFCVSVLITIYCKQQLLYEGCKMP